MLTIDQIYDYVLKLTRSMGDFENLERFTTSYISDKLSLSRTLTSQYLNQLVKDDKLIKISSRPVYYFAKKAIEKNYTVELRENEYLSLQELQGELMGSRNTCLDFDKAIGAYGSIEDTISQIKSALSYPDNGLPILILGESGVGKSYLVGLMNEFLQNNNLISPDNSLNKLIVTSDKLDEASEKIFGSEKVKGFLEKNEGLLYIKNVDLLSEETQLLLSNYIISGYYSKIGETTRRRSKLRLVLEPSTETSEAISKELLNKIPVVCKIPCFEDRYPDEKEEIIIKFFLNEQTKLNKDIYVSKKVLDLLINDYYKHNLNSLSKVIKNMVANVFINQKDESVLSVRVFDLPQDFLKNDFELLAQEEELIAVSDYYSATKDDQLINFFKGILDSYQEHLNEFNKFIDSAHKITIQYSDYLMFEGSHSRIKEKIIQDVVKQLEYVAKVNIPMNCYSIIARMLHCAGKNNSKIRKFEDKHSEQIMDLIVTLKQELPEEYKFVQALSIKLKNYIEYRLPKLGFVILALYLSLYNKELKCNDTIGIIITHGYSTASSIADAANTLLRTKVFEAINMPLDTSSEEIFSELNRFILQNSYYKNIVLMVDMGSLESIGCMIQGNVTVGVINNISTLMAISIGQKILNNEPVEEMLASTCKETEITYKIVSNAKKSNAIIFTSDAGTKVSTKISHLFKKSMPRAVDIELIEYDYNLLALNGADDPVFKKYNVLLIVKPYTLNIEGFNQVSLEDIINGKDINRVNKVLSTYFNVEEIEEFNIEFLKNFSLISIMENITILNASVLLDKVSIAVQELQIRLDRKFQSKTIVGMYIHICFLVERLITKNGIETTKEMDEFIRNNQDFIRIVNQSFEPILNNYSVTMPIGEIVYLYDYIKNDDVREN